MKNYVLLFLLFLLAARTNAQENSARKIVKAAFQKATGGKPLTTFEAEITYGLPGKIPTELMQPNPMLMLLDSLMPTLPDSMQRSIKLQMDSSIAKSYQDRIEMFKDHRKLILADITNKKIAVSKFSPNAIRGIVDTSRAVYGIDKEVPFPLVNTDNPILLLQLMASDTSELHYTGSAMLHQNEQHLIQVKIDGKWVDTYIDKKACSCRKLLHNRWILIR